MLSLYLVRGYHHKYAKDANVGKVLSKVKLVHIHIYEEE